MPVIFINDYNWTIRFYGQRVLFNDSNIHTSSSDRRLKSNICNIKNYKDFIMSLHPKEYIYTTPKYDTKIHLGFIADDVYKSLNAFSSDNYYIYDRYPQNGDYPVDNNDPNTYWEGLNYIEFIAPHVALTQEHEQEINKLKNKISILEDKIESLLKYIKESKED